MSTLKLFLGPFTGAVETAGRKRPSARAVVALESLEGRALLSQFGPARVRAAEFAPHAPAQNPHPGPILNLVGNDHAVKSPRFYPFYTGVKRADLNVAGSFVKVDRVGNGTLIGIVAGNPVSEPASPDEEAYYVFGINRGGATFPGPFPGRPAIAFDATVTISVLQSGVTGEYKDLNTGLVTPLPADSIQIIGDSVRVAGVANDLTPTGPGQVTITFWASNGPATAGPGAVASFVPEFRGYPVVAGRVARLRR